MKHSLLASAIAVLLILPASAAFAQSPVDTLSRCLTDGTTGKERKDLARWLFTAMAAHPEIKEMSKVTPADQEQFTKTAGATFTRLLSETCAKETKAAVAAGGPAALQAAFSVLGQMAMQELMSNPQVAGAMNMLEKHIDRSKVEAALK
jgi:hypothetical protein